MDADDESVTYRTAAGAQFVNGPAPGFSSVEIRANPASLHDETVRDVKAVFETARVVA